ncbi:MAG: putative manganese-dependent inorganic diphosphatase [Bacilli bacterium]|nr:putative manganese-dependent inorganic diphosphatase [Bacilli bacterium]MDD3304589.1 putative manganese-dependent inorganic diphosphatase [Bacilli bacterium]MDD4053767.1 putative manganese-dependent inorganic diphosphatase [Bacilli bacterium]MDD4411670.1 putative manganese-dependent inorganic diphosphatase [Bacilli bacterium]
MKDLVYVSGHRNPDADSICSAISYAAFKNLTSSKKYVPIRLGEINAETKFILDYFNVQEPELMESIKLRVSDLECSTIPPLKPNISIAKAADYFEENGIGYSAVVDDENKLCGLLTASNLNKVYTDDLEENILFNSKTTIENIIETLNAKVQYINKEVKYFPGKIWIAAMRIQNIRKYTNPGDIVIIGDRDYVAETLIEKGVSLIILTGGALMSEDILKTAIEKGITVISTNCDSLLASRLLLLSIPISYVMATDNLVSFEADDLVKDIKNIMIKTRYRAFPIVDESNNVLGIISRYSLLSKDKKKLIQVDHNEYAQSIDGVEEAEIIEVIDHHRVADIQTSYPIFFRNEPVGSTSTIVAEMFLERGIDIDKPIAGLLMSGILSDTLLFKSPTCTSIDIDICRKLAALAGVEDINAYAFEMQKATTKLSDKSVDEIFNSDFKEFKIDKLRVGIGQMNTLDIDSFSKRKEEMLKYMGNKQKNEHFDILLLVLTDIIDEGSLFVATGMLEVVEEAFNVKIVDNEVYVPGILSRKKQIVPVLSKYLIED